MESDWPLRGRLPTLPSVAELLASSSRPASESVVAYHHQPTSPPHSTPPSGNAVLSTRANAPASSDQSYRVVANHASHASPTESATSTSSSEHQYYQPSSVRPLVNHVLPVSTSETCRDSQTPMNGHRQDSAIAQPLFDTSTEGVSSETNFHSAHPSSNDDNISANAGSKLYPAPRSPNPPASTHVIATPRSHEHVARPPAPVPPRMGQDSPHRRINPALPSDHPSTSNTRQQRYNVRFAANHTPSNMPSAQKSRSSPPPLTAAPTCEPTGSVSPSQTGRVVHTVEPAIQAITRSLQPFDEPLQSEGRGREPSVERCPGCSDTWDRPLPDLANWDQDSPAENANGFALANMNLINQIQRHGKEADEKYEQWKEKHSHCPGNGYRASSTNLENRGFTDGSHIRALDGHIYAGAQNQPSSSKRKSEAAHGDSSKSQRVTFESALPTAPSIPSAAPT
ncbi:hypothetical protein CC86DRAFT_366128 [Ophiobolus disseminans]|uniref:Uncharacterized protein n=1 Tax=Ophiobolus disseminans TaxID=1469910 RepID=A0A6A7AG73_9PLEO|nr:hypothetical protein CC86DRAFT_366128 [Ophiobolus disseminans]